MLVGVRMVVFGYETMLWMLDSIDHVDSRAFLVFVSATDLL